MTQSNRPVAASLVTVLVFLAPIVAVLAFPTFGVGVGIASGEISGDNSTVIADFEDGNEAPSNTNWSPWKNVQEASEQTFLANSTRPIDGDYSLFVNSSGNANWETEPLKETTPSAVEFHIEIVDDASTDPDDNAIVKLHNQNGDKIGALRMGANSLFTWKNVDTGLDWNQGTVYNITVSSIDYQSETLDLYINGQFIQEFGFSNSATTLGGINVGSNDVANDGEYISYKLDTIRTRGGLPSGDTISGTVRDDSGDPVSNATVRVNSVNYGTLQGTIEEKRAQADDILQQVEDTKPGEWLNNQSASVENIFKPKSWTDDSDQDRAYYAAMHHSEDWLVGVEEGLIRDNAANIGITNDAARGPYGPGNPAPAGETLALSAWDPWDSSPQDAVEGQLPGGNVQEPIVVKRLVPGGVQEKFTVEPNREYELTGPVGDLFGGSHHFGTVTLSAGYYVIHPEGHPERAYPVPVGDEGERMSGWAGTLRDRAEGLDEAADRLQSYVDAGQIDTQTVTSNENGTYSVDLPNRAGRTTLLAYRLPEQVRETLDKDPQNLSLSDAREYYDDLSLEDIRRPPSLYATAGPTTTDVPAENVTLRTTELSVDRATNISKVANITDRLQSLVDEYGYGNLPQRYQDLFKSTLGGDISKDKAERVYEQLSAYVESNQGTLEEVQERWDEKQGDCPNNACEDAFDDIENASDATADELRERIETMQETITSLQETISAEDTSSSVDSAGNISGEATFPGNLDLSNVIVRAEYANGTSDLVSDEYINVEQSASSIVPGLDGTTTVSVSDYPIGDASSATLGFDVANAQGIGSAVTEPVRNPAFSGTIPDIDAVRLSSMSPETGDVVEIEAQPGDAQAFGGVTNVSVFEPDGDAQARTLTETGATFRPDETGPHTIRLQYANVGGQNFSKTFRVQAVGTGIERPPTLRVASGPTGTYALAADGLRGGEVETSNGQLQVAARFDRDSDARNVRVYTMGVAQDRKQETEIRVTRGPQGQTVNERIQVALHGPDIGSDGIVYRKTSDSTDPLPREGGSWGTTTVDSNGTLAKTVTAEDGTVTIKTNSDPDWTEEAFWIYHTTIGFDIPLLAILGPGGLAAAGGGSFVLLLGGGLILTRRRFGGDQS